MVALHTSQWESLPFFGGKIWNLTRVAQQGRCTEFVAFDVDLIYFGWSVHTLCCTKKSSDKIYPNSKSVFTYSNTSFV